jgi:glucose-6-phosphate isomerase
MPQAATPPRRTLSRAPAWRALAAHGRDWKERHLRALFAADEGRQRRFSREACGLYVDFSKQRIDDDTLRLLLALAEQRGALECLAGQFAGRRVNFTEKRAALHTALRAGEAAPREVRRTLERMRRFSQSLREGSLRGAGAEPLREVLSLGIGGSALGPALVAAALAEDGSPRVYFAATPGAPLKRLLAALDPARTLVIVQSKSFATEETLRCAETARQWLAQALGEGAAAQFAAVTAVPQAARALGIAEERIFPIWDWIGGRYSLWSAAGLPAMLAIGAARFDELLRGAAAMDAHAAGAAPADNLPLLLALLDLWNVNVLGAQARAVFAYEPGLGLLPDWLQQLEMESLGKCVNRRGKPLRYASGAALWGGQGTAAQHTCFQWLHQGTHRMPAEFVACAMPAAGDDGSHALRLAHCFAQSSLLMRGLEPAETGAAGALAAHQALPGNRPSTTLLLPRLDAASLGALLALYEHRTALAAAILDINAFDQYGVEHGKRLAGSLLPALSGEAVPMPDASTAGLIERVRKTLKT